MDRLEKISGIAGSVAGVLVLIGLFEQVSTNTLFWKLFATAVGCLLLTYTVERSLARWASAVEIPVGIVGPAPRPGPSGARIGLAITCLALLCGIFVILAWLLTERFIVRVEEFDAKEVSRALITASYTPVSSTTIQLPNRDKNECSLVDGNPNSFPPLDAQFVDLDSRIPKIHVDNFSYPQRVVIECRPPIVVRSIKLDPATSEVYLGEQVKRLRNWIFIMGGLIWLAASFRLSYTWRSALR